MAKKNTEHTFIWALTQMQTKRKAVKRSMWGQGNARSVEPNKNFDGFVMNMVGGSTVPWTPSSVDLFAEDWELA